MADVAPYEKMKLRLLKGAHSLIAYLGHLNHLAYVRDVLAVPERATRVRRHTETAATTFDSVPGIRLAHYIEQLLARFASRAIAHRTAQIAMDGSQELPQRIFLPAIYALAVGADVKSFAYATLFGSRFLCSRKASTTHAPSSC